MVVFIQILGKNKYLPSMKHRMDEIPPHGTQNQMTKKKKSFSIPYIRSTSLLLQLPLLLKAWFLSSATLHSLAVALIVRLLLLRV